MSDLNTSFVNRKTLAVLASFAVLAACSSGPPSEPITAVTFKNTPCGTGGTLQMTVNTATRIDCSNGGTTVTLAGNGASYLVIPELSTDQVADNFVAYHLASGNLATSSASTNRSAVDLIRAARRLGTGMSSRLVSAPQGSSRIRPGALQRAFDLRLRRQDRARAASGALRASIAHGPTNTIRAASITVPASGSARNFQVIANLSGTSYKTVTATLTYVGASVLLYIDNQAPANGFSAAQLQAFGQYFDQILYPLDTATFGTPTDIDQNGHVIMLMSPVVNGETPAADCQTQGFVEGFFDGEDFTSTLVDANSNQGEIFYSIVPDPSGTFSCAHTVTDILSGIPATFLHELQHLISFSQHAIVHNAQPEIGAEDEGMSLVAEELGSLYWESRCPPPQCRTNPTKIYSDSSDGFLFDVALDSYSYVFLPDTASLTLHDDSEGGFSWRGGDWAMMRWLGDQFGVGIYKKLEQGLNVGIANIQSATGQNFTTLFGNFGLALYTDSLPGLPRATAPAANRFTTRNLRQLWLYAFQLYGPPFGVTAANPFFLFPILPDTTSSILSPGALSLYRLDTPATSATVTIEFAQPGGAAMLTVLNPQIAIYRLPAGQ